MESKPQLWLRWVHQRLGPLRLHGTGQPDKSADEFDNEDLKGYPNNHNYVIDDGRLIPGFDLYHRWQIVSKLYSNPVTSLLDIGSCKGWFVFDAAMRSDCEHAVGIDVHRDYIELSEKVQAFRNIENASFHAAFLRDVFEAPHDYGAPFANVLIINTYHYLFWGSWLSAERFGNHRDILEGLAGICSDRVIFANPLSLEDAPRETRLIAKNDPDLVQQYTKTAFFEEAERRFIVEEHGKIGKRNLLVLKKRREQQ